MIKDVNQISTKKGDTGFSKNFSNESIKKTDVLFDTIGSIDELTSFLGLVYHFSIFKETIQMIQRDIQTIMSLIATNPNTEVYQNLKQISEDDIVKLEAIETELLKDTEIGHKFVLPGSESSLEGAYLDVVRSISRRVERQTLKFIESTSREDLGMVYRYLNRLSDLLFIMARNKD